MARQASSGCYSHPSTRLKLLVILTLGSSILVTEQYFSMERDTARATFFSSSCFPLTVNCKCMSVNTEGILSARLASTSITQSVTCWRLFSRISETSIPLQPPSPTNNSSMGRVPRFLPPLSGEPSVIIVWPLSVSASKAILPAFLRVTFIFAP